METYLLGQWATSSDEASQSQDQVQIVQELPKARDDWMAEDFVTLCVCCELKIRGDNSEDLDFCGQFFLTKFGTVHRSHLMQ